jgi:hypothetical protein
LNAISSYVPRVKSLGLGLEALVTLDGDVIGMNSYDKRIGTPFLLLVDIYEILSSLQ